MLLMLHSYTAAAVAFFSTNFHTATIFRIFSPTDFVVAFLMFEQMEATIFKHLLRNYSVQDSNELCIYVQKIHTHTHTYTKFNAKCSQRHICVILISTQNRMRIASSWNENKDDSPFFSTPDRRWWKKGIAGRTVFELFFFLFRLNFKLLSFFFSLII